MININWWESWCKYTGFAEGAQTSSHAAAASRPSPINNDSLQLALQQKGDSCLPLEQPEVVWKILPTQVWVALHSWYGGGPIIQISSPDRKISYIANKTNVNATTSAVLPAKRRRRPVALCYVCFKRCRAKACSKCKAVAYCGSKCQVGRLDSPARMQFDSVAITVVVLTMCVNPF